MEASRLPHFLAQQVFEFRKTNLMGDFKILICGSAHDVSFCIDILQKMLGFGIADGIIVATDSASSLKKKYSKDSKIKIVEWDDGAYEDYLINRVLNLENVPIMIAIDLSPSLRRLHRISRVISWNSLVIIREEGVGWRSLFPALFAAFEENGTQLVSYNYKGIVNSKATNPESGHLGRFLF